MTHPPTTRRIVVCDDVAPIRALVRHQLAGEHDLEVVGEGGDGRAAVDLVRELRPDVLLLDIAMPELDGLQATEEIRTFDSDVAIVMFTGFGADRFADTAKRMGADGYVEKGAEPDVLRRAIEAAWDVRQAA